MTPQRQIIIRRSDRKTHRRMYPVVLRQHIRVLDDQVAFGIEMHRKALPLGDCPRLPGQVITVLSACKDRSSIQSRWRRGSVTCRLVCYGLDLADHPSLQTRNANKKRVSKNSSAMRRIFGCEGANARSHPKMRRFTTAIPQDPKKTIGSKCAFSAF